MKDFLDKISTFVLKGSDPNSKWLLSLLGLPVLAAIFIGFLVIYIPYSKETQFIAQLDFIERLKQEEWRVLYTDPKPSLDVWNNCQSDLSCPANPRVPDLFLNGELHKEKHVEKARALRGKRFWISRVFTKDQLQVWRNKGAEQILLGYFYASIELFVDGERILGRKGIDSRHPLLIKIPEAPKKDIYVAIRLLHDMDEPFPDSLFVSGVINSLQLERHLRDAEYYQLVRPSIGMGFSLGLGFLFLILWLASWKRQEFAAFAVISILQAPSQAMLNIFVWLHLGNFWFHRFSFVLACYHALAIVFLGLTISRIRTWYSSIFLILGVLIPWLFLLGPWNTDQFFENSYFVYDYIEWNAYFIAIFLIYTQARLVSQKRGELWDPFREHKMYIVALLLLSVALVKIFGNIAAWDMRPIYTQFVISILAVMMVAEYRRQINFVNRSPISKYHQLAKSLSEIKCWVVSIDLKNSEKLFRIGADMGIGGSLVKKLMFHLSNIINGKGGELISSEGDAILFFIPDSLSNTTTSLKITFDLCVELEKALKEYLKMTELTGDYELRIALDSGIIRPIWHELGGKKLPGWEQVGASTVFVDLARMHEVEAAQTSRSVTGLVVRPDVSTEVIKFFPQLKFEKIKTTIKHGRVMELALTVLNKIN